MAIREFKICQNLGFVDIKDNIGCFQFNDNQAADQKIETVGILDQEVFVLNRTEFLFHKRNIAETQFVGERKLIGRFEKPGAKYFVDFDCRTDDLLGQSVFRDVVSFEFGFFHIIGGDF